MKKLAVFEEKFQSLKKNTMTKQNGSREKKKRLKAIEQP